MRRHIRLFLLIFSLSFLTACSDISELIYHDREKFTFDRKNGSESFTYLCKPSETTEGLEEVAKSANQQFTAEFDEIVDKYVNDLVDDMESSKSEDPSFTSMFSGAITMQSEIEELVLAIDKQHNCLFIDSTGLDGS